jgi:hypothetical protein
MVKKTKVWVLSSAAGAVAKASIPLPPHQWNRRRCSNRTTVRKKEIVLPQRCYRALLGEMFGPVVA